MARRVCVLVRGLPAAGKTTFSKALARRLKFVYLAKDDVRSSTMAQDKATRRRLVAAGVDEQVAALVDSNAACYQVLSAIASSQFDAGATGCILEGPGYGRADVAGAAVQAAVSAGAACVIVDCVVGRRTWLSRLAQRRTELEQDSSAVAVAHSSALAHDPAAIDAHYPDGARCAVQGADVHCVEVDGALPVEQSVDIVVRSIEALQDAPGGL
jgi:adenylate kinase family enzyme